MTKEITLSGCLSVVFATVGVAPPTILALIAYVGLWLDDAILNPQRFEGHLSALPANTFQQQPYKATSVVRLS